MNPKKPSSDAQWMKTEVQALRSDVPNPDAVDRAVSQVLAFAPARERSVRSAGMWKAAPLAAGLGAAAFLLFVTTQPAKAASLKEIADAVRRQSTRHSKTYRPNAGGALALTNEDWIDGVRHVETYFAEDGVKTVNGYNGERMFVYSTKGGGFVDDVEPSGPPIESIDSYMDIPGARVLNQIKDRYLDVYTVACPAVKFDLYVDPATRLPIRRDVLSLKGRLIERNEYDYPVRLAASLFEAPPVPSLTDYPALRQALALRLNRPGQTKEIGGVKITLKAVIFGKSKILALWTGGAKGDRVQGGDMWIEDMPKPIANGRPDGFTVPPSEPMNYMPEAPISVKGRQVFGDGAWYPDLKLDRPFTINVPVWTEDRTQPLVGAKGERLGYHSKIVGRLTFRVTDPIQTADPDRVVWKPSGEPIAVKTGDVQKATP